MAVVSDEAARCDEVLSAVARAGQANDAGLADLATEIVASLLREVEAHRLAAAPPEDRLDDAKST